MQVCTSLQTDNHASTSPLSFLQAGCPSCRPTNSVKALKARALKEKYTYVEMASRKIQTYQNKAKNLCTIYFVFDFDGECKLIETKHYSD